MNCLCCGRPLPATSETAGWHKSCIKRFFGTSVLPKIEITEHALELLVLEGIAKGVTVPGVQKKLSLQLMSEGHKPRLTLVNYPTGYILKPQVEQFTSLPEAEQLVMSMADVAGIATVPHALISTDGAKSYITKRVDRIFSAASVQQLAMEDFCQLDMRLTQDKYRGSYERCAVIIKRYSSLAQLDLTELYMRLIFCFVTGNSDMHLKNFSLIETEPGSNTYKLSPAYDLLPVNVVMPEDKEQTALTLNGKKSNIRKKDFLLFAERCGIESTPAQRMMQSVVSLQTKFISMCEDSYMPEGMKEALVALITERCKVLQ